VGPTEKFEEQSKWLAGCDESQQVVVSSDGSD
jgi:hypothetical protein